MAEIGIRDLKSHTSEIVRRVRESGEAIDITYHGRVVARLVPIAPQTISPNEVAAILTNLDELAADISSYWPPTLSAVDAVNDVRRDL